jgi:hypothetical protein
MPRLKWLILDANAVITLHELGIWSKLIERCDVHLARTVVENEAVFFDKDGDQQPIDLSADIGDGRVQIFDVSLSEISRFRDRFDPVYIDQLDPGETESLAYLLQATESFLISSGDAIVFRVLGLMGCGDQGISLEEVLQKIGLQQGKLPWACQKAFREKYTREGQADSIRGRGLRRPSK